MSGMVVIPSMRHNIIALRRGLEFILLDVAISILNSTCAIEDCEEMTGKRRKLTVV